jgi:hypothetical protein
MSRVATAGLTTEPVPPAGRLARLASPTTALALAALTLLVTLASGPLAVLDHQFSGSNTVAPAVFALLFIVVGTVVARGQPRNPIGWLLLGIALALVGGTAAGSYALLDYRAGYHGLPLVRLAVFLAPSWSVFIVLLPLPILLFPDGRPSSSGSRRTFMAYLALGAAFLALVISQDAPALVARHIRVDSSGELAALNQSRGVVAALYDALLLLFIAVCLALVVHQVLAYRQSTGVRRQQLKWLMSGGAIALAGLIASLTVAGGTLVLVVALPISIGVGVLRYRLYEIDRLISRTLSYALLTALLVGTFIGLIALTTDTFALSGRVGVAASTLVAAALFNPLRLRIQRVVDRRFNRAHYDAEATVAAFTARLRDAVEIDAIRSDLLDAVNRAVQPTHASIWIKP